MERGHKVSGKGASVESTLDRLLEERAELAARVDALDAEIRSAKEQRRQELLGELAMAVRGSRAVRRWSNLGDWLRSG
jgi:hypothetical protein